MIWAYILGGLTLLALGGEFVVRGGVATSLRLGVSKLMIGVVMLGFGTSLPELVTSLQAAMSGSPDIAVGNVVGSNIANLLLIGGVATALTGAATSRMLLIRDGFVMLAATLAFVWLLFENRIDRMAGFALLGMLALYLIWAVTEKRDPRELTEELGGESVERMSLGAGLGLFVVGVGLTLIGARLLVLGAIDLARDFGVSEALIGVSIVAIGTSLPELATAVVAALRRHAEMAIGNIFGSNIFNICAIVGVTASVEPLPTPSEIMNFDMWAMLAATIVVLMFARTYSHLSRTEGWLLLLGYATYLGVTVQSAL